MNLQRMLASFACVLAISGCTSVTPVDQKFSGFLGDYSKLEKVKTADGQLAMRWVKPGVKRGMYKALMIDPVVYYPEIHPKTPEEAKNWEEIRQYMTQRMRAEVSSVFPVTDTPGPGVVRMRGAITAIATPLQGIQVHEVLPVTIAFAAASTAMGYRDRLVVVYHEGEIRDSMSNELISQVVHQGYADKLDNDREQVSLKKVQKLMDTWAKQIVHTMQHALDDR
jgi:hypothetical protein